MKITKLVHSCIVVEKDGIKVLVDPGNYSWNSGLVKDQHLSDVDYVVITHGHPDHCDESFIKEIHKKSPNATWFSTSEVAKKLSQLGPSALASGNTDVVKFIKSDHNDLSPWLLVQPEHTSFILFNEILIGGDTHMLDSMQGAKVFAGAINGGPWGSVVGFAKMIEFMKDRPELVLPLHDWHFNDDARSAIYSKLPEVLSQFSVGFQPLENGISIEI